ncbi:hypothetical protein, partial [Roseimaritima ulvae]|uniref:hypothetical protein n=1 Tax=Roseimaritima ulvae TaxID=980254 RepID=UPI001EE40CFC
MIGFVIKSSLEESGRKAVGNPFILLNLAPKCGRLRAEITASAAERRRHVAMGASPADYPIFSERMILEARRLARLRRSPSFGEFHA